MELTAYYDSAGVLTIGYGHTNRSETAGTYPVSVGQTITAAKADEILKADLVQFEKVVTNNVTYPINQNLFDALVSFTFNLIGYAKKLELEGPKPKTPEEAVKLNNRLPRELPVYDVDGETIIGKFWIGE